MHQIEVDDDVMRLLKGAAEPFTDTPNSVLRRVLGIDPGHQTAAGTPGNGALRTTRPSTAEISERPLRRLIAAGLLSPGDTLALPRPRLGVLYEATVLEDGRIDTGDECFDKPSPAAAHCTGTQMNGYKAWRLWNAHGQPTLKELNRQASEMGF
jgi:hypothetical protein